MNDNTVVALSTPSSQLVEFLLSLTLDNLPVSVLHEARIRLLDSLGCGLYGAVTPWGKIAAKMVYQEQSHGRCTILGYRTPVGAARAALVNGTATHGIEIDDAVSAVHPGAVVVSAALATAEQYGLSGTRLLLGVIAGYEATSRVADAIGEIGWGFHKTGIAGVVGGAVASGVTLGLPHEQLMCAIGIACSSAAGIRSFAQNNGGMIKRMHAGHAAESGVTACLLAQHGFTAPLAAVDGKFGLLEVYGGKESNPQVLVNKLGEQLAVTRVWTKVYPCCGALQSAAQGLQALRIEHGIEPSAIKKVRIGGNHRILLLHTEVAPKEMMTAQYSMPFTAAMALVGNPKDPRSYTGDALTDPAVCDLAKRVELYQDAEMEAVYPRQAAHVEVHLTDGRKLDVKILDPHGTHADPCSEAEVREKFRCLAPTSVTDEAMAEISSVVERMETLSSVEPLSKALRMGVQA